MTKRSRKSAAAQRGATTVAVTEAGAPSLSATGGEGVAFADVRWADLAACASALLGYAFLHGGLFYADFLPAMQAGLVVGIIAAFVAYSAPRAGIAAAVGVALGALIEAPLRANGGWALLVVSAVVVAGVTAWAFRWVAENGYVRRSLLISLGVVIIVGNLWLTTATLGANQVVLEGQTMFQFMTTRPTPNVHQSDQVYYLAVVDYMKDGLPYYSAVRRAYNENTQWKSDPPNVLAVRQPLLLSALASLPGDGRSPIWALALVASVAGGLAMALARNIEERAVRLISLAAVAAYFVNFTTFPFVLGFEPWAGALAVICAGLFALSLADGSDRRHYWLMGASAMVAVLSVAVRELMFFLPVAGIVAALFAQERFRRFDLAAWIAALVGSGAALGLHFWLARAIVTPVGGLEKWFGRGGLGNVAMGIVNGARYISALQWLLVVLAILGIVGALLQREVQYRVFLALCLFPPLLFFLVAWNGAIDSATSKPVNYWGSIVSPLLFAMVPAVLGPLMIGRFKWPDSHVEDSFEE